MIELMILGFLVDGPVHGYDLRRRMEQLHGYARPLSDGTIYPAIARLAAAGLVTRSEEPGSRAAVRRTLQLTEAGRAELVRRLRDADGHAITDHARFAVILAFLSLVPERAARDAVLRRRLDFLDQPASFFYDGERGDRPVRAEEVEDPYRRGLLLSARSLSRAERAWIRDVLADDPDSLPPDLETS
ncbi:PadR family transcriptional regulator [Serinibacter arcticus]|uniref:PadR family transcriptional regulator n=1 Tax=Serinibacter arcticus TaxID=1655435 RepID=A0A2U2A037_9MICO|nr:PadR family transcriptional regulator [Serinibacter arcticus]PWD52560.1 PadR family transcriptional regulator [Serinibacter arcticus]